MSLAIVGKIAGALFGFGGSRQLDTVDNTVNHIASGIDKLTFTEQEKSVASAKGVDQFLEFIKANNDQNSERSRARRNLATLWIRFYLLSVAINMGFIIAGRISTAVLLKPYLVLMGSGTLMVLGFYFGVHLVRGLPNRK